MVGISVRTGIHLVALASVTLVVSIVRPTVSAQGVPHCPLPPPKRTARPLQPPMCPAMEFVGTYAGTVTPAGGLSDNGVIVVGEENGVLTVLVGPDVTEQYRASDVQLIGNTLRFRFVPLDDVSRTIDFEVAIQNGRLSGTATMTRRGILVNTAQLEFRRLEDTEIVSARLPRHVQTRCACRVAYDRRDVACDRVLEGLTQEPTPG